MEAPVLAVVLNHELALACSDEPQFARSSRHDRKAATAVRPFVFITYAVEIEGEAPLYFFAEAVDD